MECSNTKTVKPNSNISETASKFAKICALKSIGVVSYEVSNLHHLHKPISFGVPEYKKSSDRNQETRNYCPKIHPRPIEVPARDDSCANVMLMKIIDTVSSLKLAYLQLQQAHIPYDPQKIIAAYGRVDAELEKLCKFKIDYKKKKHRKAESNAAFFGLLQSEIKAKEVMLAKLQSQNSAKDFEILRLQQELQNLEMGNKNLHEKIKRSMKRKASVLSVDKFKGVFNAASKCIRDFAKALISLMKASGYLDLDVAAKWIENEAVYSKRCDKKYAFEAYIARIMFHGTSLTSYDVGNVMKFDDPIDALVDNPDSDFSKFCRTKYLLVVHPIMEELFFGNLDHRILILSSKHPRTEFYQLFAKLAKWVWVLVGSAASIDPHATMFYVNRGGRFSGLYMESVEEEKQSAVLSNEESSNYIVQFMIMPGFKIGHTLVKSRVYISKHPLS
ncbi:hypothetical protein RJT34_12448 [Clitoria ternatea]|uniref:DUF641 domain-containing protein n=1 Tax=Clitoria ternatea TaxID=43366 RepID=A0AAN9PKH8_CLITE